MLKKIASKLPGRYQQTLKRIYFGIQIRRGTFESDEKEYYMLDSWVSEGDWVLDIGANVGHYTCRLSEIVGANGRVIAIEPIPQTFELLAANISCLPNNNVTLLNVAASDTVQVLGMDIPKFDTGLDNYYMARLTNKFGKIKVICEPIDCLRISNKIKMIKIDVEGHELSALHGMNTLLDRDHPLLIIEGHSDEVNSYLDGFGYTVERIPGSPNSIYCYIPRH